MYDSLGSIPGILIINVSANTSGRDPCFDAGKLIPDYVFHWPPRRVPTIQATITMLSRHHRKGPITIRHQNTANRGARNISMDRGLLRFMMRCHKGFAIGAAKGNPLLCTKRNSCLRSEASELTTRRTTRDNLDLLYSTSRFSATLFKYNHGLLKATCYWNSLPQWQSPLALESFRSTFTAHLPRMGGFVQKLSRTP